MLALTTAILALSALCEVYALPPRSANGHANSLANVTAAFEKSHIVPDVLPSFNPAIGVETLFTDAVTGDSVEVVPGILLSMEREYPLPLSFRHGQ
jgi:hypothetical protein